MSSAVACRDDVRMLSDGGPRFAEELVSRLVLDQRPQHLGESQPKIDFALGGAERSIRDLL